MYLSIGPISLSGIAAESINKTHPSECISNEIIEKHRIDTCSRQTYDDDDDDDNNDDDDDNDDDNNDDDDDGDVYLRLQHGKGFHNLVYMSYAKHINPASKA
jgi:hypothetical protein